MQYQFIIIQVFKMKSIIIVSLFFALIALTSCASLDEKWELYKIEYNKVYGLSSEDMMRKEIFAKNLDEIDEHNQRFYAGKETYEKGINQFTDLTYEEFVKQYLGEIQRQKKVSDDFKYIEKPLRRQLAPASFLMTDPLVPIKDQGACGSCWAFAAVASIEYRYKQAYNKSYTLSEQELVDCESLSLGCAGGWSDQALEYVAKNGLSYEKDYPYKARDQKCYANDAKKSPAKVKNVCSTPNDETSYKDHFYQYGPLVVYYFVDDNFKQYKSGVFTSKTCNPSNSQINHAVLVIGYGMEGNQKYWLVRNSWGTKFGENGHFRILRDANMCNLGKYPAYYPEVV